jgi:hypothetical protein
MEKKETPPEPEIQESGNKIFDPKKFKGNVEFNTTEVVCPELNDLMGITEGNVVFKVRQATLDEYFRSEFENDGSLRISELANKLNDALMSKDNEEISKQLQEAYNKDKSPLPYTSKYLYLCKTCVVEPKIAPEEIVKLSKFYPTVIVKVATAIIKLTESGGVKKNS